MLVQNILKIIIKFVDKHSMNDTELSWIEAPAIPFSHTAA